MRPIWVATYTRVGQGDRHPSPTLARRQARLAAAVRGWPGYSHAETYADAGPIPPWGRPGLARLMADAAAGQFDVVVVEQMGRLSPRAVDVRAVVDRLAAFGIPVRPLSGASRRRLVAVATAAAIIELAELL